MTNWWRSANVGLGTKEKGRKEESEWKSGGESSSQRQMGTSKRCGLRVSRATFFVQNNSRIPIHIWTCKKRDTGIPFHAGTVISMVRIEWERGNEKTLFSMAKNFSVIWEFMRDLWFGNYEKCAPESYIVCWQVLSNKPAAALGPKSVRALSPSQALLYDL